VRPRSAYLFMMLWRSSALLAFHILHVPRRTPSS
jgi:hypothetical protein